MSLFKRHLAAFIALAAYTASCGAVDLSRQIDFAIPAQKLDAALMEFSRQAKVQVIAATEQLRDLDSRGISGSLTISDALSKLLSNSGLVFKAAGESAISIGKVADARTGEVSERAPVSSSALRLVRLDSSAAEDAPAVQSEPPAATRAVKETNEADAIVVTGTRVKGVKDQFSAVTSATREEMDLAGFDNVFDLVDSLPQNFGGGVSFDTTPANSFEGPGGAGANLRGLGNQATLVLLNGRRLAPAGLVGDFVDLSSIPTAAIERVEVVTDGASAIYGSDAIAGVVNVILRKDFSGAESRLNLGTIGDGGGDTLKVGQTVGWSGEGGHALLTYEYATEDELDVRDKDFASVAVQPSWLLPYNRKHNVFVSGGLQLSERLSLSADGYYNKRDTDAFTSTADPSLIESRQVQDIEQIGGAASLNLQLANTWEMDLTGGYSKNDRYSDIYFFNYGMYQVLKAVADMASADVSATGSIFQIAGNDVKAVVGAHYRTEDIESWQGDFGASVPLWSLNGSRNVRAVFSELYAPVVSQANSRRGINRLAFSIAARYDEYSDVGSSFDPKFGVAWSPVEGLNIRGTYSTAFRAPRLEQLVDSVDSAGLGVYLDPQSPTGSAVALFISGEKPDLEPEQATTWTLGFDFNLSGLQVRATYFNIDYTDRMAEPFAKFDNDLRAFDFPGVPIRNPSAQTVQALVDAAQFYADYSDYNPALGPLDLADVTVILDSRDQNLSASLAKGFDVELSYGFATDTAGDWTFLLNSTYLTDYTQQFAPSAPVVDLLNTVFNPVDLKVRGGALWNRNALTTALYVNYIDSYKDNGVVGTPVPIDSWTTVDTSLRLDLGQLMTHGFARGATLSFTVSNVFNTDPPPLTLLARRAAYFDAANSDPTGRRFGLQLTKHWGSR